MNELKWRRSGRGNLFLRSAAQRCVGIVYRRADGQYGWKLPGQQESAPLATEQEAIEALYAHLGSV